MRFSAAAAWLALLKITKAMSERRTSTDWKPAAVCVFTAVGALGQPRPSSRDDSNGIHTGSIPQTSFHSQHNKPFHQAPTPGSFSSPWTTHNCPAAQERCVSVRCSCIPTWAVIECLPKVPAAQAIQAKADQLAPHHTVYLCTHGQKMGQRVRQGNGAADGQSTSRSRAGGLGTARAWGRYAGGLSQLPGLWSRRPAMLGGIMMVQCMSGSCGTYCMHTKRTKGPLR